jgi:hypothetical protein
MRVALGAMVEALTTTLVQCRNCDTQQTSHLRMPWAGHLSFVRVCGLEWQAEAPPMPTCAATAAAGAKANLVAPVELRAHVHRRIGAEVNQQGSPSRSIKDAKRAENQEKCCRASLCLRAHVGALRACKHSAALASGTVFISCSRRLGSRATGLRLADAAERNAVARTVPDVSACVQRFARDLRCARLECCAPAQRLPVARSDLGLCARIGVRVRDQRGFPRLSAERRV